MSGLLDDKYAYRLRMMSGSLSAAIRSYFLRDTAAQ
jgi:hypothetical protein